MDDEPDRDNEEEQIADAQQQNPQLATIPVVVLSAAETIEELAPRLTVEAYLPKPIDFDALLTLVEQYCSQSRQRGMEARLSRAALRFEIRANGALAR